MKGKSFMESELYDGEYFIQKVSGKDYGLQVRLRLRKEAYRTNYSAEALEIMKTEGPKYQYGKGCLSDGILGMWMATVCGLNEIVDNQKIISHLRGCS